MAESAAIDDIRDEDGLLQPEFVAKVSAAIAAGDGAAARRLTDDLHEADLADLIMALNSDERVRLIELLGRDFDVEALPQLDEAVRDELMEALPNPLIASVVGGFAGYGTGALMPLVLVPIVGAEPVVPILSLSALFTNTSRAAAFRRQAVVLAGTPRRAVLPLRFQHPVAFELVECGIQRPLLHLECARAAPRRFEENLVAVHRTLTQ